MTQRLNLALPSKGRLREPSWALLEATGVEQLAPGERVLQSTCRNADIDLLFLRADDVPEYVQDGVVDCGITGLDLVQEHNFDVDVLLELGYGRCSLQAAVSLEDTATSLDDLNGRRIATSHPNLTRRLLEERGIAASIVRISGSVEIAPRLGLADAIVDLVSTGSTLRTNGLRSLGILFESQAVLVGRRDAQASDSRQVLTTLLGSVLRARSSRYLLMNVRTTELDAVTAVLPAAGSPTIVPLATEGLVAIHALVPASDVWSLLPKLQACGATAILTLPVERLLS